MREGTVKILGRYVDFAEPCDGVEAGWYIFEIHKYANDDEGIETAVWVYGPCENEGAAHAKMREIDRVDGPCAPVRGAA